MFVNRFLMIAAIGLAPSLAWADCPGIYSGEDCTVATTTTVCEEDTSGMFWICDLSDAGGPSTLYAATIDDGSGDDIYAFGDYDGEEFCCSMNDDSLDIEIYGSSSPDTISLVYDDGSTAAMLEPLGTPRLDVSVRALGGGDDITGSDSTSSSYYEILFGGNGNDTIDGGDGDDRIGGGAHDDTLTGGDGDDYVCGHGGDDDITDGDGDSGVDHIYGGFGTDDLLCQNSSTLWGDSSDSATGCTSGNLMTSIEIQDTLDECPPDDY